jgi:hypothetical protein
MLARDSGAFCVILKRMNSRYRDCAYRERPSDNEEAFVHRHSQSDRQSK